MLGLIWWMYGGYSWLTNAVAADTVTRRLLLLGGMGGYFCSRSPIPGAFAGSGLAFGLAYLVIVGIHTALFTRAIVGERRHGDPPHHAAESRLRRVGGCRRRRGWRGAICRSGRPRSRSSGSLR